MPIEPAPRRTEPAADAGRFLSVFLTAVVFGVLAPCCVGTSHGASLTVTGPEGAALRIDGRSAGVLPLPEPLTVEPGPHAIRCDMPGYRPFVMEVRVADRSFVRASFEPMRRSTAVTRGVLFAGLGQRYIGRPRLAWVLAAIEAGGLTAGLAGEILLRSRRDDYSALYEEYQHALTEPEISEKRAAAEDAWRKAQRASDWRNTGLIVAAGAVVVGVLDAWLRYPAVAAGPGASPAAGDLESCGGAGALAAAPAMHLAYKVRF